MLSYNGQRFIAFIALTFVSVIGVACLEGEKAMASGDEGNLNTREKTSVRLDGRDLVLTLHDAQEIRRALENYLSSSRQEIERTLPQNLLEALPKQVGDAWIDQAGSVRMAPWLLGVSGNTLVLTHRPAPPTTRISYQYVAHLDHTEGRWKVTSITFAKIYPR
jgi:hypothetical protein